MACSFLQPQVEFRTIFAGRFRGAAAATLTDVWEGTTTHVDGAAGSFTTDAFGGHDSRFYIVTPAAPSTHCICDRWAASAATSATR